jgi:hypothetical protein
MRRAVVWRIAAGVVGIAVFVAAIWVVASVSSLNRSQTSVVPGGDVTGPAETRVENPEPPPLVELVQIGTVTRSAAGCALEGVPEPIPVGSGRLTVVNETNRRVGFDLFRFDPEVLTFGEFEAYVAGFKPEVLTFGEYATSGPFPWRDPDGAFGLIRKVVRPGASETITDFFFKPGGTYAMACHLPPRAPEPIALVGPIVVP